MAGARPLKWKYLCEGGNNTVYIDENETLILKIRKKEENVLSTHAPERSVEVWNAINFDLEPKASLHNDPDLGSGWICPFIEGDKPSMDEIHAAVIDIYNRTGRIVLNASMPGTFIKRKKDGRVIPVNIGQALQLEKSDTPFLQLTRRKSIASLTVEEKTTKAIDLSFEDFKNSPCFLIFLFMSLAQTSSPQDSDDLRLKSMYYAFRFYSESEDEDEDEDEDDRTRAMKRACLIHTLPVIQTWDLLQALIVIKTKRPDILNVDFLKNNRSLIEQLAKAYQTNDYTAALEALETHQQDNRRRIIITILEKNHEPGLFGPTSFVDTLSKDIATATKMTDKTTYQKYIRTLFKQDKISLRCAIQLNQLNQTLLELPKENKENKAITIEELETPLKTYNLNKGYLRKKFHTSTQTIDDFTLLHKIATDGEWKSIDQSCINLCLDAREKRSSFTRNMRFFINKYRKKRTGDKPYDSETNIFIESIRPK